MLCASSWPGAAKTVARTFGVRGTVLRASHELRRMANGFRAEPRYEVPEHSASTNALFTVDVARLAATTNRAHAISRANRVVQGSYEAYRWDWRQLPRHADAWIRHPHTGHRFPADAPWWEIPHLDVVAGDIKDVWEPARFAWVYDLVRASMLTGDPLYTHAFQTNFDIWRHSSPPFRGPHWSCGQETAIRAIALLYAEANIAHLRGIVSVLAASGERIADAIGYAVSQRNNHAISEAVGLIAIGARLRDVHPEAAQWLATGRHLLARLIMEQFEADGWYAQHSFTYMRLALDQCIVAERVLRRIGSGLPPQAVHRVRKAVELLFTVVEPESGTVPNHGANDGAFVHPITLASYRDFRPVLTAACATWHVPLPSNLTPCDESLAWLGADRPVIGHALTDGVWRGESGWASVRDGRCHVFMRAGRYSSRPSHLDALHADVRFGRDEIVVDPGTFAYNAPAPWRNGLASAFVHNGPLLDDEEPGVRGPRFLWYAWPDARIIRAEETIDGFVIIARATGGATRTVTVRPTDVHIEDGVEAGLAQTMSVTWLLHPNASEQLLRTGGSCEWMRAVEGEVDAWYSPEYGCRLPSIAARVRRDVRDGGTIVTTITSAP